MMDMAGVGGAEAYTLNVWCRCRSSYALKNEDVHIQADFSNCGIKASGGHAAASPS